MEQLKTLNFYKENSIWYIDLPEFLEDGLGTKANLMMVDGADIYLDNLNDGSDRVTVKLFTNPNTVKEWKYDDLLKRLGEGKNQELLDNIGHAPVDCGMYYYTTRYEHRLWLCPVTLYVFEGKYPNYIFIQHIKNKG